MTPGPTGDAPEVRPPLRRGTDFTLEETYRATRLPVDRARTLNPEAYRSPEYDDVERQRVFSEGWVCVGYTAQLIEPGATLVATVAGPHLPTVSRTGTGARAASVSSATASPCPVTTAGWMPQASSRSS